MHHTVTEVCVKLPLSLTPFSVSWSNSTSPVKAKYCFTAKLMSPIFRVGNEDFQHFCSSFLVRNVPKIFIPQSACDVVLEVSRLRCKVRTNFPARLGTFPRKPYSRPTCLGSIVFCCSESSPPLSI